MDRPERRHGRRLVFSPEQFPRQKVGQHHIQRMQQEVDGVIPAGVFAVAQNRVIKEVGERRHRPVQAALCDRPPIGMAQNQAKIFTGRCAQPGVLDNKRQVIQRKTRAERVRIGA